MKSTFTFLLVLFTLSGLFAQTECAVKVVYSMNKTQPLSYTFTTDPVISDAKFEWLFGDQTTSDSPIPMHVFKATGPSYVKVKISKEGKVCYGKLEAQFEGGTPAPATAILSGKGKVKMPGSNEGCRLLITLENGTVLAPVEIMPAFEFKEGQYIELAYELQKDKPSGCTTGVSAKIHKIALINVSTVCKVPVTFKKNDLKPVSYTFSTTAQPADSRFYWYFGDGGMSELASPNYVFKKAGTWSITLKVVDKSGKVCYGEAKTAFEGETNPPLAARGKVKKSVGAGCDLVIALDNGILIPAKLPADFKLVEGQYVEFTYEKLAEKATICNEGAEVKILTIKVIQTTPECKTYFTATNKIWSDPAMMKKVAFTNLSTGDIAELTWNFGDNTTLKNEPKPIHEYTAFGTYKVCLSIITKAGCKSEYCAEVKVESLAPTCKFDIVGKPKEGAKNTFVFYTVSQAEIKSWKWSFGDGKNSDLKNPENVYEKPGTYEVTCTITTASGCNETRIIKQTVLAAPLASCSWAVSLLLFDATANCNGKAIVKLVDASAKELSGVKYIWSHGFTGSEAGNLCPDKPYTVQAIIEGVCQKNTSFTLLSKPVWTATNVSGQTKFSVITPVEGVVYEWNLGNGVFLKGAEVDYNFKTDGIYDVTLKAANGSDFTEYSQKVEVLNNVTKVVKIDNPELDVYPNPVKDVLKIKFGNPVDGNIKIEIMNIAGKSVYYQELPAQGLSQTEVNVNQLNPGIYFLRIMNGKHRIADRKFIKAD